MSEKVIVLIARKASDGDYGSYQTTIGIEDEVPEGTNRDSFEASLYSWCKAVLDRHMGDLREEYLAVSAEIDPAVVEDVAEHMEIAFPAEEKPPLPSAYEKSVLPSEPETTVELAAQVFNMPTEVRTSIPEGQKTFKVNAFVVAQTDAGDKYLQVWGDSPDWSRKWVPAWSDQAELLFGDLETMDLGTIPPPYPLEATVEMGTWKNPKSGKTVPSPQKVIEWTRIEG